MTVPTTAGLTIAVCLLAAVIEVVLACTSTARLMPTDLIIVVFVMGPYLLLGSFAWRRRGLPAESRGLLAVAVGMSAWGLYHFGIDSHRYHTEPQYRMTQRLTVFFVPLLQYVIVLAVRLTRSIRWLSSRRDQRANHTGPDAAPDPADPRQPTDQPLPPPRDSTDR
jgi:UDP-N-acetylmuramyl pentapeptide phosphotransferase/UDP-N-acetylglucosamine-1-phosphate transferase